MSTVNSVNRPISGPVARHMQWRELLGADGKLKPWLRFVVALGIGMKLSEGDLKMGDEVPAGALAQDRLRILFDHSRIKLHPSCDPNVPPAKVELPDDLDKLGRKGLYDLCVKYGVGIDGSNEEIRNRLLALVG